MALPTLQRGFVWRSDQIENLWDSILRGYPIGSFVASREGDKLNLLDGQQRATAIFFGLFDPTAPNAEGINPFQRKHSGIRMPRMFLDLRKPHGLNLLGDRKYIFRHVTPSHPWGYDRVRNRRILRTEKRFNALKRLQDSFPDSFGKITLNSYFQSARDKGLDRCLPFDADLPVPFWAFLNASSESAVKEKIQKWGSALYGQAWDIDSLLRHTEDYFSIREILDAVSKLIAKDDTVRYKVCINEVPSPTPANGATNRSASLELKDSELDESESDLDDVDEIENLFLRLNLGGTRPSNEEVNYSIIKSKIEPSTEDEINAYCGHYFDRARFVVAAYVAFRESRDGKIAARPASTRIKPLELQRELTSPENKNAFDKFLHALIQQLRANQFPEILFYSKQNSAGFSKLQWIEVVENSPALLVFMLLRLWLGLDTKESVQRHIREYLGCIGLLFLNSDRRRKQRYQDALLKELWPMLSGSDTKRFWSSSLISRAWIAWGRFDVAPVTPSDFDTWIKKIQAADMRSNLNSLLDKEDRKKFYGVLSRYFLLHHAQRELISEKVENDQLFLEEHNRPFDYDHIVPDSWLRRAPKILQEIGSNLGNKRVLPFAENRSRGNDSPAETFKDDERARILSVCSKDWLTLTNSENRVLQKELILERMGKIFQSWAEEYAIKQLLSDRPSDIGIEKFVEDVLTPAARKQGKWDGGNFYFPLKDYEDETGLYFYIYINPESPNATDGVSYGLWIRRHGTRPTFSKGYEIRLSQLKNMRIKAGKQLPEELRDKIGEDHSMYTEANFTISMADRATRMALASAMKRYLSAYGFDDDYFAAT